MLPDYTIKDKDGNNIPLTDEDKADIQRVIKEYHRKQRSVYERILKRHG
jgi:hypothetical protein